MDNFCSSYFELITNKPDGREISPDFIYLHSVYRYVGRVGALGRTRWLFECWFVRAVELLTRGADLTVFYPSSIRHHKVLNISYMQVNTSVPTRACKPPSFILCTQIRQLWNFFKPPKSPNKLQRCISSECTL